MIELEWHGWEIKTVDKSQSIHIGRLPGRKSVCLYTIKGSTLNTLAFFRNEEDAATALELLDLLVKGSSVPIETPN